MSRLTCTDCIHDYVCHNLNNLNYWNKDDPNGDPMDKCCLCFKNKELFIELPCKVGDTVWICEMVKKEYIVYDCEVAHNFDAVLFKDLWNIKVFPTKAEAEAKLAELKGGDE